MNPKFIFYNGELMFLPSLTNEIFAVVVLVSINMAYLCLGIFGMGALVAWVADVFLNISGSKNTIAN